MVKICSKCKGVFKKFQAFTTGVVRACSFLEDFYEEKPTWLHCWNCPEFICYLRHSECAFRQRSACVLSSTVISLQCSVSVQPQSCGALRTKISSTRSPSGRLMRRRLNNYPRQVLNFATSNLCNLLLTFT